MRPDPRSCVYLVGGFGADEAGTNVVTTAVADLLAAHKFLKLSTPVTIYIASGGGSCNHGLALQSVVARMRREGRVVIGHVAGYCMSSAFDLLQQCDIRRAERTAALMLHEEQVSDLSGSTTTVKREWAFGQKSEQTQLEILASRTGKPVSFYRRKILDKEWYLTAQEALNERLIDEIVELKPFPQVAKTKS